MITKVTRQDAVLRLLRSYLQHIAVLVGLLLCYVIMFGLFRATLALQHADLLTEANIAGISQSFYTGLRFDLRVACIALLPATLLPLFSGALYRCFCKYWFTVLFSVCVLLSILELEFYREFQQRLNILVVQYLKEDPATVLSMIWHGFPVVRYLCLWLALAAGGYVVISYLLTRTKHQLATMMAIPLVLIFLLTTVFLGRGTTRSGPPLRWGDAYQSDVMFLNHLALNGSFTLAQALLNQRDPGQRALWSTSMPQADASSRTQELIFSREDNPSANPTSLLLRSDPSSAPTDKPLNVVVILMESFSGQFVGALGNKAAITPAFDNLAEQGVLFTRGFSSGTHTHQGTFATLSCFPNLPGHEYLMQQPEGMNDFSGISAVLPDYESIFIYNGDFSWDNQQGFFTNQGVDRFIGRGDYIDPVFEDDVWGVSDEDMFNRAVIELDLLGNNKGPFLAFLQTLSNHMPYKLPAHEKFSPVTDQGSLSERLTAMKYSDWALGEFFRQIQDKPWYDKTIFVVLGDHGFGTNTQLTEVNLLRFHVPILFIAPGLTSDSRATIASQVDVIPTILGLMNSTSPHQCWGRNLLGLDPDDQGFAMIKPSGNEPTTAFLKGNNIVTFNHEIGARLYNFALRPAPSAILQPNDLLKSELLLDLQAYVQSGLLALSNNTSGVTTR
mgnify:CR=1 FL=1